jgi:hypothetical protein
MICDFAHGCLLSSVGCAEHAFHRMGGDQGLSLIVLLSLVISFTRPPVNLVLAGTGLEWQCRDSRVVRVGTGSGSGRLETKASP